MVKRWKITLTKKNTHFKGYTVCLSIREGLQKSKENQKCQKGDLTSKRHEEHQFTGWNTQQITNNIIFVQYKWNEIIQWHNREYTVHVIMFQKTLGPITKLSVTRISPIEQCPPSSLCPSTKCYNKNSDQLEAE